MASIKVNTNLAEVSDRIRAKLEKMKDKEQLLRPLCFDLVELMTKRIHERGENASGSPIGTYSNSYLKYRGKGDSKNNVAPRGTDSKVIVSLTRELENDWSVIATPKGYGIGFKNSFNLEKARWVEGGYESHTVKAHTRMINTKDGVKKIEVSSYSNKGWSGHGLIFSLTDDENKYASDFINEHVSNSLSSND